VTPRDVELICVLIDFCRAHGPELSMRLRDITPVD